MAETKQNSQELETEEQEFQDQPPSEVAKIIAERNSPDAKTESEQQIKEEKKSEEKSDDNEIQLTAEAVKEFKELGYEIEDLEEFDAEELKKILKDQLKKEPKEVKQPEKPSVPVVTEELAMLDKTGFLKTMIGQPISKMAEHISNLSEYNQRLLREKVTKEPEKETDSKTTEEMLEEIDFLELSPKEAAKAIKKIVNSALEENDKKWEQKLSATIQPISKAAEKEALKEFVGKIQTKLPKEVNAGEIFNDWLKNSGMSDEAKIALAQSEEALITVVVNYGKEKHAKVLADEEAKKLKKKSKIVLADEVRKKLKEADNTAVPGAEFNATRREEINTGDPVLDLKKKILDRHS